MKYTPEEVAKLLANRPNQQHYIEAMIRKCIDEAIRPSAEVVLARGWYHFRKGEDGAADDYDLYDSTASPCADCIPVKIVRADTTPSPEGQEAESAEKLGERCIDGGKCNHACTDRCFRRECCSPFDDYQGPWAYPSSTPAEGQAEALEVMVEMVEMNGFGRDYAMDVARAALAAQQPAAPSGEAGAFDANFLQSVASLCRAAYDLCQPKPQRTPEDPREHYGELCLLELTSIADEIERRLAAAVLADREAQQQDKLDAARWRYIRRKLCLTGNGDGTCAMQAINLPAAIQGWPEPGQVAEFCDAAIDQARGKGVQEVGDG